MSSVPKATAGKCFKRFVSFGIVESSAIYRALGVIEDAVNDLYKLNEKPERPDAGDVRIGPRIFPADFPTSGNGKKRC